MEKIFLCGGNKYQYAVQTIGLPLLLSNLPEQIAVEGNILLRRTSFHVSLVSIGEIIKKNSITTPEFEESVIKDFCDFVGSQEINLERFSDEYRFVEEKERKSVVAMCIVSNLEKFYDLINAKYQLHLECPPTHVTLYTLQPNAGIFVTDSNELTGLTKIIPKPKGISL